MGKNNWKVLVAAVAAVILFSGCSATGTDTGKVATHYWEGEQSAPTRYQVDNTYCMGEREDLRNGAIDPSSNSFDQYHDCMVQRGYTLRQY